MGMQGAFSRSGQALSSDINVTPMIDILLVLLIIFMAISPEPPKGLEALLTQTGTSQREDEALVLEILHTSAGQVAYKINKADVQKTDLRNKTQGDLLHACHQGHVYQG